MRRTVFALPLALAALAAVTGCRSKTPSVAAAPEETKAAPMGMGASAPAGNTLTGKVLEKVDAEPYTYLKLQTAQGEKWAAVPTTDLKVGAEATVLSQIEMKNFESKSLKRTFPQVFFGNLAGAGAPEGAAPAAGASPHGAPAVAEAGAVKVEKAAGADARTVGEVFTERAALKDKTVVVRGKVMKFLPDILKKNWVHLQDGTGDPKAKTHDLTVTLAETVKAGDVITVRGTLRLNKDFGAGYTYEVIVEDAKVQK
ncbi:MAG TPA: OB-fold nucleic acid binding domain-containing protein [Holophagaceae bacterium]|nr:OB-fold nucleic acid binding domain-containing protein [Holophagaceae bacterium]